MPKAVAGVLVECDQAIKATLVKIDQEHGHQFIQDDIDDQHLLINSKKKEEFKELLDEYLKDTQREPSDSESDSA